MPASHSIAESKGLLGKIYAFIRIVSLDVVIGSLGGGIMAARLLEVQMSWAWYVCLPLAVWLIYTLDHLMDAHRLGDKAHTARHLFHHQFFWPLLSIWMVLAPLCLLLALAFLPVEGVYFGLAMCGAVGGHLLLVKLIGDTTSPLLVKELGVGFIYAAGVWGLPLIKAWPDLSTLDFVFFLQFLLLALMNLLEFSIFEYEIDELDGHTSFVRAIGTGSARTMVYAFGLLVAIGGGLAILAGGWEMLKIQSVFLMMAGMLSWILWDHRRFGVRERYRIWGDAVFLAPFLFAVL